MKKDDIFITGDLKHVKNRVQQLILNTLESKHSDIDLVAVKMGYGKKLQSIACVYNCTIQVKTLAGNKFRSEASDCDEMLAVYGALSKIIDGIDLK